MAFCNNCGRPLKEGEVCTCQSGQGQTFATGDNQGQGNNGQTINYQGQQANQNMNYNGQQANQNMNYNGQQPNQNMNNGGAQGQNMNNNGPKMNAQSQAIINDIKTLVLGVVKAPVETVNAFMQAKTFVVSVILIVLAGLVDGILGLIKLASSDYSKYYEAKDFLASFFNDVLGEAVAAALFALVIWLVVSQIYKTTVGYDKAITVFALREIAGIPAAIISWVLRLFKISFFTELASCVTAVSGAFSAILMYYAIRSILGKEKESAFTYALAAIGTSFGYYFISLMFR